MNQAEYFSVLEGGSDALNSFREIQKAFEAGGDINIADLTAGQAGRIQSLQSTFISITFKEEAAAFWRAIPKRRVTSTVNEYSRLNEVANSIFYEEGGDVDYQADDRDRKYSVIKFMGVKYATTFPALHTKFISPAETQEIMAKTRSLVRGMDLELIHGDSSILPKAFDGLIKQVTDGAKQPTQNIIDLRGKRLTDENINDAVTAIKDNFGYGALRLWLGYEAINGYIQHKIENRMYFTNAAGDRSIAPVDQTFDSFKVGNGRGTVDSDVFFRSQSAQWDRLINTKTGVLQANHDSAPVVPTAAITSESTTTAYSLDNGDYDYLIVPESGVGLGIGLEVTITHTGGSKRTKLVITQGDAGTLGYRIYRRAGSSTDPKDYFFVKREAKGTSPTTVYDDNENIPGTSWGAMVNWDGDQVLRFNQLMDMVKLPYGIRADKREGLLRVYGNLEVVNENKIVLMKNIGKESLS